MTDMEWAQPGVRAVSLCNGTPTRVTVLRATSTQIVCMVGTQAEPGMELRFRRRDGRNAERRGTWDHPSWLLPLTDERVIKALTSWRVELCFRELGTTRREVKDPQQWLDFAMLRMLKATADIEKIKNGEVP